MSSDLYVQYGCGWNLTLPAGWRHFDASPTLRFERIPLIGRLGTKNAGRFPEIVEYGDIVKGLPIAEGNCKAIYCSHVLEHLSLEDFRRALQNTYRLLQTGGVFRAVMPDLEYAIQQYVTSVSADAALAFLRGTALGRERRNRNLKGFIFDWLGNNAHLWMWDYKSLEMELRNAGFGSIRRAQFGDSADAKFQTIENPERWQNALSIECTRNA